MKVGDLVAPKSIFPTAYNLEEREGGLIGVVTRIINANIVPNLIEVRWTDGTSMKVYSDDVETQ